MPTVAVVWQSGPDLLHARLEFDEGLALETALAGDSLVRVCAAFGGAELDAADGAEEVRHVLVDDATSETSVRGLFAVGDMSRHRGGTPSLKQIYTAQEDAVRAVQKIDRRARVVRPARVLEER